jgi:hypothetical protein
MVYLSRDPGVTPSKVVSEEETNATVNKSGRLSSFLLHSASFGENADATEKCNHLVELIVLAHHNLVCESVLFLIDWTCVYSD